MQELIAQLVEALKEWREAQRSSGEAHKVYEVAEKRREIAYRRVGALQIELGAEIRSLAGYSAEDIASYKEQTL
jgi:hypothetical protein